MNAVNERSVREADDGVDPTLSTIRGGRFSGRTTIVLIGLVLSVLLVLLGLSLSRPLGSGLLSSSGAGQADGSSGQAAPNFTLTLFNGETFRLSEQQGRAVVLNFWASWCTPCRAEMPYFETTYRAYRDRDVVFVGVAVQDELASAQAFLNELGITYPAGLDEGNAITLRYQVSGLPTTVFITRDGKLARRSVGTISEKQLVAFVEAIAR